MNVHVTNVYTFIFIVINVLQQLNNALKWNDLSIVKQCIANPILQLEFNVKAKDVQYAHELLMVCRMY